MIAEAGDAAQGLEERLAYVKLCTQMNEFAR